MLIFAHRGASADAPENTLASIAEALAQKADGIEVDVRMTGDNNIVALHDKDFFRTAGSKVKIAEADANFIKRLDAGIYKDKNFKDEKVPFIEDILDAVPAGKLLQIHIKGQEASVPFIIKAIKSGTKKTDEIMIISSRLKVLESVGEYMKEIFTAWIYARRFILRKNLPKIEGIAYRLKKVGAKALDFDCRLNVDKKNIDLLRKFGIQTYSWTVDDPQKALSLKKAGVEGIATNKPAFIRNSIENAHRETYE